MAEEAELGEGLVEFEGAVGDLGFEVLAQLLEAAVEEAGAEEVADAEEDF